MSMDTPGERMRPATRVVAVGRPTREPGHPVNPPITLSTTFHTATAEPDRDWLVPPRPADYARTTVDTWEALEAVLGDLDGGTATVFASGMAATHATLDALLFADPDRPRVVVSGTAGYTGTAALLAGVETRGWAEVRRVDLTDDDAVAAAVAGAGLVWVECPANPLLSVPDVRAIAAQAHRRGARVAVDATFATPLRMRPLELGADVSMHSATKMIAGHSDVLLGVAVTGEAALDERLRQARRLGGAVPGPFEAWLALRGLRTLDVRLERAERTAGMLAERLSGHPAVSRVRYPGLPTDPGHAVAAAQSSGFGALLAIEVADAPTAEAVASACRVWTHATSLGGVESLIERRRKHAGESPLVPQGLLRLSVGIEDAEDLWQDLRRALSEPPPRRKQPTRRSQPAETGPPSRHLPAAQ